MGDRGAFRRLYEANANTVLAYTRSRVSFHQAEDVTAETFCVAWSKLDQFTWQGTPFRGWLLTIAKNLLHNQARRSRLIAIDLSNELDSTPDDATQTDMEVLATLGTETVGKALREMPAAAREVLVLRFLRELSVREVATKLEMSEENVRVRTFRALADLRRVTAGEL